MVHLKSLSLVNSRDNLANSSSKDNLVNNGSNLSRARASNSSHLRPNSPHQRSDSTGKAEMIYAEMFCAL